MTSDQQSGLPPKKQVCKWCRTNEPRPDDVVCDDCVAACGKAGVLA